MRPEVTRSAMPDETASDATTGSHGSQDDHGAADGHDDHAHTAMAPGPLDVGAWGAGLLGILLGLIVAIALAISSGYLRL